MKQGWQIKKLGEVCKVIAGQSPRGNAYNDKGVGIEFHQGKKAFGKDVIQPSGVWTTEITKMAEAGDILMSVRAPVGPTNFTDRSLCIGRGLAAIRCSKLVLPQYVLYALKNIESKIVGKDGAVFNSISKDMIEDLPVPKLTLSEQQRIVALLDAEFAKIDALKANAEKNFQNAKDLFQAALKKELEPKEGWNNYRLGDICTITSSKRIYKNEYVKEGIPFYRTKEIKEIANGQPISLELYISTERYLEIKKKYGVPQINDILVSAVGTIGEMMIVKDDNPFYFKDGNLVWLRNITKTLAEYLRYYLLSAINRIKEMTIGAAYNALTIEKFQEMQIGLASDTNVQQSIVARLDALSEKCKSLQTNYEKTIALCDDLKQALLRKAFNGEI